ncbi:MAG: hypothetical protein ACI8PZ_003071 [Myxococcota bacterium]
MSGRLFIATALLLAACGKDKDGDTAAAPSADELEYVDLGSVEISDTGDYTGEIDVEVPEGTVGSLVYCGGFGDSTLGAIWELKDPTGALVYTGDAPDRSRYRSEFLDETSTGLLSVTPNLPLTPGTYKVNWFIGRGNGGSVSCGAVHRVDEISSDAPIAVELVFVGGGGLDAASAQEDEVFQAVIDSFSAQWGAGKLVPQISYSDFAGDLATYSVVDVSDDDFSEFNDLLRTANPANPRTLVFFMVDEIANASAGGATILGLSAGPPGGAGLTGTSKSGVVVSTVDYASAPEDVAKIMAHEGGHFLGLYHTSESDGSIHDPLPDTTQCTIAEDSNGNGVVNSSECGGKGAENVMWWTLSTAGSPGLTVDQSYVLRRNPLAD